MTERLTALREKMAEYGIDAYIIPTSDFHASEYVDDYFKCRKYVTGFTGSAGVAVVTAQDAELWTDGRYFIQAAAEIKQTGFHLMKMGEEGTPSIVEYLKEKLPVGGTLGFDGRVISCKDAEKYVELAKEKQGTVKMDTDLVDLIWKDRPQLPMHPVWILTGEYSGETTASKLSRIRTEMEKVHADVHLLCSLYDIAWILNLRGDDIAHVPVFLSFLVIKEESAQLYIQKEEVSDEVMQYLSDNQIEVRPYEAIYEDMAALCDAKAVMMDDTQVNVRLRQCLPEGVAVVADENPSELMKSIKNETELANTRKAHLKDGIAMTKFMYWLKTNIGKIPMDEYSASVYLDALRAAQEHYIDLSFSDISAYGPNAAMMHYSATEDNCAVLEPKGMLLVDSGGHYLEGSTDVTRTFILGEITEEERRYFTIVAKCNLALANAQFLYGCRGVNLDILCRGPLWQLNMDYKCGTGHGVGHILNVHEGPNGFRWRIVPERKDSGVLEAGQITTDEPGVYIENCFGIRTENELICEKREKNEYGQFMGFENITYVPIDLDGIDPEELSRTEKKQLNDYHAMVFEKLSPHMTEEENEWLKTYTRAI